MNLNKIKYYCHLNGVDSSSEYALLDMGGGPFFQGWNLSFPQPTDEQLDSIDQTEADAWCAEQQAAAEQARINGLAWKYGGLVGALSAYLARVGWSIPCEAAEVTADLLKRDLGGQLTPDQKDAKANVADTYMMLSGAGMSNADIAAVWEKVKS